ncbi:MAG: ABC transporter permease [Acidobacteria bacterium]|nr:MAG: ABC transporter permease [Acidobacteriota bacterium]
MNRILAIIERDMRRFRRSPLLVFASLVLPLTQLVVLGYAFGGKIKHLKVGVVDQDHGLPAIRLREMFGAIAANAKTFDTVEYADPRRAMLDMREGRLQAVINIPPDFSRQVLARLAPRVALIEDNTDNFSASTLQGSLTELVSAYNQEGPAPRIIIYIDDKARGLHEGYLVTPITKVELILGFNLAGTVKGILAGTVLTVVGSFIAGVPHPLEPLRLFRLMLVIIAASLAFISMMFLLMVRISDPLVPRAIFGVLNALLFFPSGAIYPVNAFPAWMKVIAFIDPFTYAVHAFKSLLLKNTGIAAIGGDLAYLSVFTIIMMIAATLLFRRTL